MLALRVPQGRGYSKARLRGACSLAGLSLPMPKLIDGRAVAEKVYADLRRDIAELKAQGRDARPCCEFSLEIIQLRALMCVRKTKCAASLACTP